MTYPTADYPTPYPAPPVNTPRRKASKWQRVAYWAAIPAALFIGLGIGLAGNGGTVDANLAAPAPEVTITQPVPGPTVTAHDLAAPAAQPTVAPKPKPVKASIADGEQVTVGADVPAGKYSAHSTDSTCYWEIDKSGSNGQDIVANDLGKTGHIVVTLKKGEDFSSNSCGDWTQQ